MPKVVQFRDLPGGPVPIEFSDEISHRNTCTQCEMISMTMYTDENGHLFCNACVQAASKNEQIFCKMDNRKVLLSNFNEALQHIIVLRSLKIYCPNMAKGCKDMCTLDSVEEHYKRCIYTRILCMICKLQVKGVDYDAHLKRCASPSVQCRHCLRGMKQEELQNHACIRIPTQSTCVSSHTDMHHHRKDIPPQYDAWSSTKFEADNHVWNSNASNGNTAVQEHRREDTVWNRGPTKNSEGDCPSPEEKPHCMLCKKAVKLSNWDKHKQHCESTLVLCDVCHGYFPRRCIEEHTTTCRKQAAYSSVSTPSPQRPPSEENTAITVEPTSSNEVQRGSSEVSDKMHHDGRRPGRRVDPGPVRRGYVHAFARCIWIMLTTITIPAPRLRHNFLCLMHAVRDFSICIATYTFLRLPLFFLHLYFRLFRFFVFKILLIVLSLLVCAG